MSTVNGVVFRHFWSFLLGVWLGVSCGVFAGVFVVGEVADFVQTVD